MGLECRRNRLFYYTKRRINGRVVSVYVGSGPIAELQATIAAMQRTQHADTHAVWDTQRTEIERSNREERVLTAACRELATALLLISGHHQHKGTWRKRRMAKSVVLTTPPRRPAPDDTSTEALSALMKRCNTKYADAGDIDALRALLPAHPHIVRLGDQLHQALRQTATLNTTGIDQVVIAAHIAERKAALGFETASALEQPLIAHLILCEQRLGYAERLYAAAFSQSELPIKQAQYLEHCVSAAQTRYLKAVETLARIRRVRVEAFASDGTQTVGVAVERPGQ